MADDPYSMSDENVKFHKAPINPEILKKLLASCAVLITDYLNEQLSWKPINHDTKAYNQLLNTYKHQNSVKV